MRQWFSLFERHIWIGQENTNGMQTPAFEMLISGTVTYKSRCSLSSMSDVSFAGYSVRLLGHDVARHHGVADAR